MALEQARGLAGVGELFQRVSPCSLQQMQPGNATALGNDHRLVDEASESIEDLPAVERGVGADFLCSVDREASDENAGATEHDARLVQRQRGASGRERGCEQLSLR